MKRIENPLKSKNIYSIIIIVLAIIYFSPYFSKGKSAYLPLHDNLYQLNMQGIFDGKMSAKLFPLEGLEEFTLPDTNPIFHIAHLKLDKLFFSFNYFWGFVFNEIFYRILAFLGMFYLLSKYFVKTSLSRFQIGMLSLAFVTLPFWPQGNLSIAGIPLLILAFINLYHKQNVLISYLTFLLFPAYSNLFLSGVFLIFIIFICLVYLAFRKETNIYLIIAFFSFGLGYVITHFPVFLNEFIYKIPTNRSDQFLIGRDLWGSIKTMIFHFFYSHKLAPSLHVAVIFPSCFIITALASSKKDWKNLKRYLSLWAALILLSILFGLFYWNPITKLYNSSQFGLRLDRLYALNPVLWFLLWSLLLAWIANKFKMKLIKPLIFILIVLQLGINFYAYTFKAYSTNPSFQEFMAEQQFTEIRRTLGETDNNFRVGCIGFYPAVANFNGFKTVDSFSAYYPLEYKIKFRKIIQTELNQNEELSEYFENKGSALFLFDDKIGKKYIDQEYIQGNVHSIQCDLNINELQKFGVKYLFSVVQIENADQKDLVEVYRSIDPGSYYHFYVYKLPSI
ncbi:DUF6044 family protein [Candidatus Cloacimonadota bacterium]